MIHPIGDSGVAAIIESRLIGAHSLKCVRNELAVVKLMVPAMLAKPNGVEKEAREVPRKARKASVDGLVVALLIFGCVLSQYKKSRGGKINTPRWQFARIRVRGMTQ